MQKLGWRRAEPAGKAASELLPSKQSGTGAMPQALDHIRVTLCAFALAGPIAFLLLATASSGEQIRDERNADFKDGSNIIFPKNGDNIISFPSKMFINSSTPDFVLVRGTLTGDWVQYPNNTYTISCVPGQCIVASFRQIGNNRVGYVDVLPYTVTEWSNKEIIAHDNQLCMRSTITIDRSEQTLLWVDIPINQGTAACQAFVPIKSRTATIKDSLGWKSPSRK
jgi:hypothetical protein